MTRADTDGDGIPDHKDPDDDNDGLTDDDELPGGTNTKNPDTDGDDQSDFDEVVTGTSGLDSNAYFYIEDFVAGPAGVCFQTVTGRLYDVQRIYTLGGLYSWSTFSNNVVGNGNKITVFDMEGISPNYRVRVRLSPAP